MSKRRLAWYFVLGGAAGLIVMLFNPVNSTLLRLTLIGCISIVWVGIWLLLPSTRANRRIFFGVSLCLIIPFCLPGRMIDRNQLHQSYLNHILHFEGVRYHWGGENSIGIDCSGLPRRSLMKALFDRGILTANGRPLRQFLELWWFDSSARALSESHRKYTIPLGVEGTVRDLDYSKLVAGDLAITKNGVHALVYLGDERWIQADPGAGKVVHQHKDEPNSWFSVPISLYRWTLLTQ